MIDIDNYITQLLVSPMGIAGVMVGTVAGHLLIFMGRTVVVYKHYVKKSPVEYYVRFLIRTALMVITALVTLFAVSSVESGFIGLLIKGIASVISSTLVFCIYSFKREEFKVILSYVSKIWTMLTSKRK